MQETQEMQVQSLGRVDPLEEDITTHSGVLARRIPWTEEPGGLQSTRSQRHDWSNWTCTHSTHIDIFNIFSYLIKFQKFHCCCSVAKSCPTLHDPMDCSTPGFPVLHYFQEFAQTHVHQANDTIQPSHPLSSPSPPAFNLSQHQGLFQWIGSSHQVVKVLELQHPFHITFKYINNVYI